MVLLIHIADDFRIFVGNIGWDVNDEVLAKAFSSKYSSFQKAKVIRDKKSNKVNLYINVFIYC